MEVVLQYIVLTTQSIMYIIIILPLFLLYRHDTYMYEVMKMFILSENKTIQLQCCLSEFAMLFGEGGGGGGYSPVLLTQWGCVQSIHG